MTRRWDSVPSMKVLIDRDVDVHKDAPFTDQYQGLRNGVWENLDVENVRILRTHNRGDHTIGVSVAYYSDVDVD